jgi:hypothetical protein
MTLSKIGFAINPYSWKSRTVKQLLLKVSIVEFKKFPGANTR